MKKLISLSIIATLSLYAQTFNVSSTSEFRQALQDASTNGENDTVILAPGIYKTTDDGAGTFKYYSTEENNLTIMGSDDNKTILSGEHKNQILNYQTTKNTTLTLKNLVFKDGNSTNGDGGAIYIKNNVIIEDCNFTNNNASYGGKGGGFYSYSSAIVANSIFTNNNAYYDGGGFCSYSSATVVNSIFTNNNASDDGGGFCSYSSAIVANSLFIKNNTGIYLTNSENNKIYNTIFLNNKDYDINGEEASISALYNNYIDLVKLNKSNINFAPKNNIFKDVNLGFKDPEHGNYELTTLSDLIDKGTTEGIEDLIPSIDLAGNPRIVGKSIDIGPYTNSKIISYH